MGNTALGFRLRECFGLIPYRSAVIASLFMIVSSQLPAQTVMGKAAQLLWYEGTRLTDSTLLTKKGHQVSYSRRSGKVNVKLNKSKDPFSPYLAEADKTGERKKTASQVLMQKKSPVTPAAVIVVNEELDRVYESTKDLRNTSLQLNAVPSPPPSNEREAVVIPQTIKEDYAEVMAFAEKAKADKDFDPPTPPSSDFDYCWECDSARQQAYRRQEQQFIDEYLGEEAKIMQKLTAALRYIALREIDKRPLSAEERSMQQDLVRAMSTLVDRWKAKVKKAWTKYSDDARKLPFLNGLVVRTSRQLQLLGYDESDFISFSEVATKMENIAEAFLTRAINEKDYKIILNIRWIIGLLRQSELLGGNLSKRLDKTLHDIAQLTKFKASVDLRIKMNGGDGVYQLAEMNGENYFYAVPDSNCVLEWMLAEPDVLKMAYKLEKIEMVVPENKPTYVGTKSWKTGPAEIKLDFCKEERDTALFFGFLPDNGQELWSMPQVGTMPMSIVASLVNSGFLDVKRMKEMAAKIDKDKMIADMMKKHQEKIQPNTALINKDPSQMTPEEMKKLNEMMMASRDISAMVQSPSPFSYLFKGPLRNRQQLVFDETLDAKKLFPQNKAIEYGTFTLKIEHARQ